MKTATPKCQKPARPGEAKRQGFPRVSATEFGARIVVESVDSRPPYARHPMSYDRKQARALADAIMAELEATA